MPEIMALLAFRNEECYLPAFFSHLRPYVSQFIVFDDNSSDSSAEIALSQQNTRVLNRKFDKPSPPHYYEVDNRRALLEAALAADAQWLLCCDADERYEKRFLEDLQRLTSEHQVAYGVRVRDLWNSENYYRVDSYWGNKAKFVLFPATPFTDYYPSHSLHSRWMPPNLECRAENILDYNLYHLASLCHENRIKRAEKFKTIDPDSKYQPRIGYDYLTDETALQLEKVPPGREFEIGVEDRRLFE